MHPLRIARWNNATIPGWMIDAETCAQMFAGEPTIGLAALTELRSSLDSRRPGSFERRRHRGNQPSVGPDSQQQPESEFSLGGSCMNRRNNAEGHAGGAAARDPYGA